MTQLQLHLVLCAGAYILSLLWAQHLPQILTKPLRKSPRLGEWGCFGTPLGEWTTLSLVVKRESKDEMKLSMTMNGVTREAKDKIKSSDKTAIKQINAIAIGYPNGRHYTYVDLADVVHHATVV